MADSLGPEWGVVPTDPDRTPARLTAPAASDRAGLDGCGTLVVVCPDRFRDPLGETVASTPLDCRFHERPRRRDDAADPFGVADLIRRDCDPGDSVLLVVPAGCSLASAVPAPVVDGVPVGLLAADRPAALAGWQARLCESPGPVPAWGVLAMGTDRYLDLAGTLYERLDGQPVDPDLGVRDWRASRIDRPTLCEYLASGPSMCVYLGHGTPGGWGGYQACRWRHVADVVCRRPAGAVISLACDTLRSGAGEKAFGVRFVQSGRARAFLGAPGDVSVDAVRELASAVGDTLVTERPQTVGALLVALASRADELGREALTSLRLVGLPPQRLG
ncbi:MAG: hypothetical protein ACI8XM_001447 [Haloarculaceae archaeon]|jgi:hypothetical protein